MMTAQNQNPGPEVSKTQEEEPLSAVRLCDQLMRSCTHMWSGRSVN